MKTGSKQIFDSIANHCDVKYKEMLVIESLGEVIEWARRLGIPNIYYHEQDPEILREEMGDIIVILDTIASMR